MKIVIPVEENKMETRISQSFGRTPFFLIYDTDTKEQVFIENRAAQATGGAGIKAAQLITDNKPEALLTPRCGQNAADVIKAANIKIYKTISDNLLENIVAFKEGKLAGLTEIHAGFHNHGEK